VDMKPCKATIGSILSNPNAIKTADQRRRSKQQSTGEDGRPSYLFLHFQSVSILYCICIGTMGPNSTGSVSQAIFIVGTIIQYAFEENTATEWYPVSVYS